MDGEAIRMGGGNLAPAYLSGAATATAITMQDPNQNQNQNQNQSQFLFSANSTALQLFGSAAGKMDNLPAYYSLASLFFPG